MKCELDQQEIRGLSTSLLVATCVLLSAGSSFCLEAKESLELAGTRVTPHVIAGDMRYARDPDPELGARVQLFVRNASTSDITLNPEFVPLINGKTPDELLQQEKWTWHDFPSSYPNAKSVLPPGAMTVWSFNGKRADWGVGTRAEVRWPGLGKDRNESPADVLIDISKPEVRITAATFLSDDEADVIPRTLLLHIANDREEAIKPTLLRLWFPKSPESFRALFPGDPIHDFEVWPTDGQIPAGDKGILRARTGPLPLSFTAIEVRWTDDKGREFTIWSHLRVKREAFDISGGWVQGGENAQKTMTFEPFLKTLHRLHVNTAHMNDGIPGYTDQTQPGGLYARYPLKFFGHLVPPAKYESAEMLPRVHAVEFLGEPQYGGGRPVAPMEVWRKLSDFQTTKLPTSVTHSEERIWRYYAGLSDYPHYDAYRVCAPSPDRWFKYDRWGGQKIGWGAPLETIGDMCRSLRELNEPMPTAYWSQGPHQGWGPMWGRRRASPTADEIRLQAYHALSSRITSLYWFNLSLPSLVKYRDTLVELERVGREIRMLEDFYLAGDAYQYRRELRDGRLDWDLASLVAPEGTLLFVLDLDYQPDKEQRVFQFHPPRPGRWAFDLPPWCRQSKEVFRVDADGTHDVEFQLTETGIELSGEMNKVGLFVVSAQPGMRSKIDARAEKLKARERSFEFDPARNDADFKVLDEFVKSLKKR
ncbi:MAG: hypothetical protein U1D30_04285 [Planctomycetota bacterium]